MPAVVYTMFGGVQAVTWTDVKIMVLIVVGLFAMIVAAILGLPDGRQRHRRPRHRRRDRPAAHVRLLVRSDQPIHVLVGHDRGAVPVLFVLRHRSEPGAALPDGAVGRRGAALAADERLLEDPAAGPRARSSACSSSSSTSSIRRRCCSARSTRSACDGRARRRPTPRCRPSSTPRSRRASGGRERWRRRATPATRRAWRRRKTALREREAALAVGARRAADAGAREQRRSPAFTDVNYIIPTFILTQLPIGLIGLLIRRDHHGGDRHDRRRAQLAVDRDGHRLLQAVAAPDAHPTRTTCTCRRSRPASGGCSPARVAVWAAELGSLIEVVNRFGSFFYGSILGVFILAVAFPRATGNGAFIGLIRRDGVGGLGGVVHRTRLPVAQRDRRGGRRRRRADRQRRRPRLSPGSSGVRFGRHTNRR